VCIRTGTDLEDVGIELARVYGSVPETVNTRDLGYRQFGVGSASWPGAKYARGYTDEGKAKAVIEAVEDIRAGLERLLKEG
jgi:hypothetical protein